MAAASKPLQTPSADAEDKTYQDQPMLPTLPDDEKADMDPQPAAAGVSKVEAFNRVLYQSGRKGKILLWSLAISIALTMFVYAFDQGITTTIFAPWATSSFGQHANLAAVSTASQIIRAVSKPFIGKMADITSRPTTYVIVLVFYVVGFVVAASAQTFPGYTVGMCFTAAGKSGLDLLSDIIVGDLTVLEWRGFFGALLSLPFIVTVPLNGFITSGLEDNWRWGMGMFAIMVPVLLTPAIITLYSMQIRGKKLGMTTMAGSKQQRTGKVDSDGLTRRGWLRALYDGIIEIDLLGLILLGFAFAMILMPFTLRKGAKGGWTNPSIIAMLVIGFVIFGLFALYEIYLAPKPMMTRRILFNRAFLAAVTVNVFSQMASSVRNTYFFSYINVITPWSTYVQTIFIGITTIGLCLVSPIVGLLQRSTHRYKTLMVFGNATKLIAYGLLIEGGVTEMTRHTGKLVASQLIFCLGSFSVVGARVGSQASVPHEDMASIISLLSLWSTLGSSVGGAIAAAIWTDMMPTQLALKVPNANAALVKKLYGSISVITAYDFNDPIRQGAIRAYSFTSGRLAVCALCLSVVPLLATFFMPNFYLGKQQNAVTNKGLDGEVVKTPAFEPTESPADAKWHHKLRDLYRRDAH
ncbi:hypothetical protein I302_102511 [Kwoniella bestiolae CBS 10118]|uniref:Major facilitator superfamily (MFS) profile domain-containing protein n=1 Tax=Kwoniella bestiolae CBS 10118 TaxID=1296100 RepID=A0A1B9GF97_9TREE|nr:hypothetical protein I302_01201 [Kwoniella bestiolae CBS 10118]OCF29689.1 hypothetical protein I302_01201 [Kwoniella bestiolae CBS 10118]